MCDHASDAGGGCPFRPPDPLPGTRRWRRSFRPPQQDPHRQLERTLENFQAASKFVRQLTANPGTCLFVGTSAGARDLVEEAQRAGQPY